MFIRKVYAISSAVASHSCLHTCAQQNKKFSCKHIITDTREENQDDEYIWQVEHLVHLAW